jgi:hypothetical protein
MEENMKIDYSDVISWQIFRDKVFVVNEVTRKLYTLSDTNKWFWLKIKDEHELENIVSELYSKVKDVTYTQILDDFISLVTNLKEEGLIICY